MLVIRLWNYLRGYVIIKIEGLTLEKFINLTIAKGIYLWDIERIDYTVIHAKIGIKAFKEVRDVVKKIGCRVNIIQKKGFPFFVHKLKYRKMLVLGLIICLGVLFFLTSLIWSIDVVGEEDISKKLILSNLNKIGIYVGVNKSNIDEELVKKTLLKEIGSISYAKAEIKGTKLIIEVKKREIAPEKVEKNIPCNIVSKNKSVIEKIVAKNGKALVEKGDIVDEGQILITGTIEDERFDGPLLVHSDGIVLGRTNYIKIIEEPLIKTIKEETGRDYKAREFVVGNKTISLKDKEIPFKNYNEVIDNKSIINSNKFKLGVIIYNYKEVRLKKINQNVDKLKQVNSLKGTEVLIKEIPEGSKIVSKNVEHSFKNNKLITKITIEVIEDIGVKQKF